MSFKNYHLTNRIIDKNILMKTKAFLLSIGILLSAILVAQTPPGVITAGKNRPLTGKDRSGLTFFTNYNTEQGLALNSVACGYRDKSGNIWFGTLGGGVNRYDGKSFATFTTTQGLANNTVYSITEDKKGNLWFGTSGGGVSRYDGKSFVNFTRAQGLANNIVYCIMEDKRGNFWFGTGGGVSYYDGKSFTNFSTTPGLANSTVKSIMEDNAGNLWFATNGSGAIRYDGNTFVTFTVAQGLADNSVNSIIEDKKGNIWFGTNGGGVSRYDGKSFTSYTTDQGLANNNILNVLEDKKGNIWFATDGGGVSRYDGKSFVTFTMAEGLANNTVWGITEDKTGNLWFATIGGGVSRYVGKSITNFTTADGLVNNIVYSIMENNRGDLWFGTLEGGKSRYDGKFFTNFATTPGVANYTIKCIIEDRAGNLWFASDGGGVSRYNGKSFTNFTTADGLANNIVYSITEDKMGKIWFGTDGGGVSRYDGKSFVTFTTADGLANNNIWSILKDHAGNLWFATYGGGVSRYDGKSFTNLTTEEGLASNNVWNITEDKAGNLWFGTSGGGVSRYDGKSFINFTTAQGLADNVVYAIVIDSVNNIFIGTNMGFSVFKEFRSSITDPSQKNVIIPVVNSLSSQELKNYQSVFEYYNKKTGYPIKNVNINAMLCDSKGIIWAGCGDNKLIRFDYNAILKSTSPPAVFIQAVKIQQENISWYNLINNDKKKKTTPEFDSLAILNEEALTFGRTLSEIERDSIRHKLSGIKFDSITRFYPLPENLVLPYKQNSVTFEFVAIEPARHFLVRYQYILEGYDRDWSPITDNTSATFGNIPEGTYTFRLKARSPDGVWSEPITYTFKVLPPWYRAWWAYAMFVMLFASGIFGIIRWRTRSLHMQAKVMKKKIEEATKEIRQKKDVIEKEKEKSEQKSIELETTLQNLKATQQQLVQREKMASLGELTASIAHEIQNPLNFVNNFSEVSTELVDEMNIEIEKGNNDEAKLIAQDLKQNLEKINHHGKRAGNIVKGMLQHSRSSSGVKEPTDINALADEYLRLSYHGLRAKDKSFNATMNSDFDPSIGKIDVIPQDLGRVILNLINNAFYASSAKALATEDAASLPFKGGFSDSAKRDNPEIWVSTKRAGDKVLISVRDNGPGIPSKILDKIFQPFFTTKPTGQGTGLGLSLSYDIVKAHGGEIKVETKEGEGAEFIIELPIK